MPTTLVLTEDEALELLAFLVTAARTQLDEAAEYGPLRLLLAASRLADAIGPRVSPDSRACRPSRGGGWPARSDGFRRRHFSPPIPPSLRRSSTTCVAWWRSTS